MADTTPKVTPEPSPAVDPPTASPAPQAAGMADPAPPAAPTKTKPVVLATRDHLTRFVIPAEVDDDGEAKGDALVVDHHGIALSRKDADALELRAAQAGVQLNDITPDPSEKD